MPFFAGGGDLLGVLDIDSNSLGAFREVDKNGLESLCDIFQNWNAFYENVA